MIEDHVWVVERVKDGAIFNTKSRFAPGSARFYTQSRFAGAAISYFAEVDYNRETKRHDWYKLEPLEKNYYRSRYRKRKFRLVPVEE